MPKIVHEIIDGEHQFKHRLIIDGRAGEWASYGGIAVCKASGKTYFGSIPEYRTDFPEVYTVTAEDYTRVVLGD